MTSEAGAFGARLRGTPGFSLRQSRSTPPPPRFTTWPLACIPRELLGAPGTRRPVSQSLDPRLGHAVGAQRPGSLLTGRVFDANIFYPASGTLAYSDHLLLQSVALSPLFALTHDVVLCYNVLLVVSLVASCARDARVHPRHVDTRRGVPSGFAWGFGSFRFAHLIHLQLQSLYFLPLAFLCLHRWWLAAAGATPMALGVVAGLQALSSVYWGIIGGLGLAVAGATLALSSVVRACCSGSL
jgi:hypothetical protein